ncbi:FAD-binding oxidoreductase [Xanthomonas albilineans]|uniref:Putative fad/fmn-containing dehydrogenase protein n=1 Tax=Xanthomonas albilineans (strain GPE PC73 / CFBP 7063) TaxID=380358 RepID=D2UEK9_XANAP|nr:FAD-binding oxidoreductase [Xanthomonas albilineans]QHQ29048.1 putative fad/fmn-containing dehydrogenase protein [Xanthomonas albilineans]CBA16802.1 putative fad/fmn-containing dehydrogenase protein [Xanthomonas albilineans GPE PC73]
MKRRSLLSLALLAPWFGPLGNLAAAVTSRWALPGSKGWPSDVKWQGLRRELRGELIAVDYPFSPGNAGTPRQAEAMANLRNAFYVGDEPALTQTSGWVDGWVCASSPYAVAAANAQDVAKAVRFATRHGLRISIRGGGHSYQGTSCAEGSLLIWTRRMNAVQLHDAFVAQGSPAGTAPIPAVTVGAGAMWTDAYHAVTTQGGRYVQGGGCVTVGVAGLVQSGGFGNFSKRFGTAAGNLLEAEVVTADGQILTVNHYRHPELFWAIKGGGGGSIAVITQMTLRTHELPEWFGAVFGTILAKDDEAYRALIARVVAFYRSTLFNEHWGEQISFRGSNRVNIWLVFQGMSADEAKQAWLPLIDWLAEHSDHYTMEKDIQFLGIPARHFWDITYFKQQGLGRFFMADPRNGAPPHHVLWKGNQEETGWFIHGYQSLWIPQALLEPAQQATLVEALFTATRSWTVALHFNKGLAGAPQQARDDAADTAMNPGVLDAFALAIISGGSGPAYTGMPGDPPDLRAARAAATDIGKAMEALRKVVPGAGAYVSESDYFLSDWKTAYWGSHYPRLARAKARYDPQSLFDVHNGVSPADAVGHQVNRSDSCGSRLV